MSKYIFLSITFNILLLTNSQFLDKNTLKAAGCVTLLKKIPNKPQDNKIITHYLLACFINIDEETANKILELEHYDKLGIEESQIVKLLDINSIQRQYTPDQINDFSILLNKALAPLKSDGKGHNRKQSDNSEDYDNDYKNTDENNGLINYIIKLFTSSDSLIFLVILFAIFYYILQKMRKCIKKNDKDDNNKKSNKKNNKINKKKKN